MYECTRLGLRVSIGIEREGVRERMRDRENDNETLMQLINIGGQLSDCAISTILKIERHQSVMRNQVF